MNHVIIESGRRGRREWGREEAMRGNTLHFFPIIHKCASIVCMILCNVRERHPLLPVYIHIII